MGAPDLSNWIWPDADQGRAPQGAAGVNPNVLPQVARVFVNGRNATGPNPATPLTVTPTGLGYTNTSNSALGVGLPGGNTLVTSNGAGTGDFSILCVTNAPPSSSVASIPYCTVTGATPEIYLLMNEPSSFSGVVSGDVSFGYWSAGGGLTLTGILDGKTHTILFTRVSGTLYGYVDGVLKGSASFTSAVYSSGTTTTETLAGYSSANWGVTGYGVPLLVTANVGLGTAQAQSISANPWQIFQPAKLGIAMPASAGGLTLTLTGVSGTSGTGSLGYGEGYPLTGSSATGSTGAISEGVSVALSQVSATGSVGSVAPAFGVAAIGVSATGSTGSASDVTALALTGTSATGSTGTVTPTQGLSAALTQVSATGSTGTLSDGLSLALSGVSAAGSVGAVSTGGSVTQALSGVSATGSVGSVAASVSLAATGVSAAGSTGSVAPTRALSGVSATGSTGAVTQSVTLALVGSSASGSTGTVSAGANKNAALTGVTGASSVGNIGANLVIGLTGVSATASTGVLVPGVTFGLVGNTMASSTGQVIVGYPSVDPITFKIYPESRKYAVSAESRTKTVAAESRTIKVA